MELISREDALAQGLAHYFTGKPCRNGHVSPRGVKKWNCLECDRNSKARERDRDPERVRANERRTAAKHRTKKLQYVRSWRERNPDYGKEKGRERWEAIKADPVAHEEHNAKMRGYNDSRRRRVGVPTRTEYQDYRLKKAVERVNSLGLVKVQSVLDIGSDRKRRVAATCVFCGETSVSELSCLANGQGINCVCKKGGESTFSNIIRMTTTDDCGQCSAYIVPTVSDGLIKYGISSNVPARFSSHRHYGLIRARKAYWQFDFVYRWQACLWEIAIAKLHADSHDRSLSPTVGHTEVLLISRNDAVSEADRLAAVISELNADTWKEWATLNIPGAAEKLAE